MTWTRRVAFASFAGLLLAGCRDASFPTAIDPAVVKANRDVHTGWIIGPEGLPMELKYEIVDGRSMHEGDINLGPAGTVPKTREELLGSGNGVLYGVVVDGSSKRWPSGVFPYEISGSFNSTQTQHILDAMALIAGTTAGLTFRPKTSGDASWVIFQLHWAYCYADGPGRMGGAQNVYLTADICRPNSPNDRTGSAAHEILHALGMWHEQSRCDRDTYITVHSPYDLDGLNFGIKCLGSTDYLSYAEGSIMHYGPFDLNTGARQISSNRGLEHLMGQRTTLDPVDVGTLNTIYQPYAVWPTISNSAGTPLLSWSASSGSSEYTVDLVRVYEEHNGYEGWTITWDEGFPRVGTTTATSLQDTQRTYTGNSECYQWYEWYGYARYTYYYEVRAKFPFGISSASSRQLAPVAPATC